MGFLKNHYAILIGVGGEDMERTVDDAVAIYAILSNKEIGGYSKKNISLLTGKNATREGILNAFDDLKNKTNENSTVMLYYSGHGGEYLDGEIEKYFLQPHGATVENIETHWVKAEELQEKIRALNQQKLIFFLDCCFAEGMTSSETGIQNLQASLPLLNKADGLAQKIDAGEGICIMSSCREDQKSYIQEGDSNSLFTKCLIEALQGKHKSNFEDEFIRIFEICQYIGKRVPELEPLQTPYANLQIYGDFKVTQVPKELRNKIDKIDKNDEPEAEKSNGKEVITVFRKTENANNAILFVHGFTGEAAKTFGNIPAYLMEDEEMDGWDMFPFGFSEYVKPALGKQIWASVDDIQRIADHLKTSIIHNFGQYKRIAIVAHGLGGLVAQRAVLDLDKKNRDRISHLLLFGTPSNGINPTSLTDLWKKRLENLSNDAPFIKKLRSDWSETFNADCPFVFKVASGTHDEFVPKESSKKPFNPDCCFTVEGNHSSMVKPTSKNNDSYALILNSLTNNNHTFLNQFSSEEEINLAIGEYDAVVKELLPNKNDLDQRKFKQLIYALEALDRSEEALILLKNHPLAKENSELLGIFGDHYKRKYLKNNKNSDGNKSFDYYLKALQIAEHKKSYNQIYYQAINLAFLNLVHFDDRGKMQLYAEQALKASAKDNFDSLWKLATVAEANLYLGNLEIAKTFYARVSKMAEISEKITIYNNSSQAYTYLMQSDNPKDEFNLFLKKKFLE